MATNCQIDFYVLQDESLSAEMLACRLALMAWEQGNQTIVMVENQLQAEQLDALMWEQPQGRYLPHKQRMKEGSAPVIIATLEQLQNDDQEVIINLTQSAIPRPQQFNRLLELVPY